jgi:hypothetical protein
VGDEDEGVLVIQCVSYVAFSAICDQSVVYGSASLATLVRSQLEVGLCSQVFWAISNTLARLEISEHVALGIFVMPIIASVLSCVDVAVAVEGAIRVACEPTEPWSLEHRMLALALEDRCVRQEALMMGQEAHMRTLFVMLGEPYDAVDVEGAPTLVKVGGHYVETVTGTCVKCKRAVSIEPCSGTGPETVCQG